MLTDKSSNNEGEVQICRNGLWSPIYDTSPVRLQNVVPRLICQQLGFSPDGITLVSPAYATACRLVHYVITQVLRSPLNAVQTQFGSYTFHVLVKNPALSLVTTACT